jgi:hypothetical protein
MRLAVIPLVVATTLTAGGALADEYFVPGAVQRQGSDGQWWNTEVWISNTMSTPGGYAAVFLPGGGAGNLEALEAEPEMAEIPPRATVFRNDLVPEGQVGALRFLVTPGVLIYARVANAAGKLSTSQGFPALLRSDAIRPGELTYLVGLRRTPQYRTAIGILNPSRESGTVTVRLFSQKGEAIHDVTYQLPAGAVLQLDEVLHAYGVVRGEHMRAELSGTVAFFAYASVVDARSGAPTLILPQP